MTNAAKKKYKAWVLGALALLILVYLFIVRTIKNTDTSDDEQVERAETMSKIKTFVAVLITALLMFAAFIIGSPVAWVAAVIISVVVLINAFTAISVPALPDQVEPTKLVSNIIKRYTINTTGVQQTRGYPVRASNATLAATA